MPSNTKEGPLPESVPRLRCSLCRTDLTETVAFDGQHITMVHGPHDGASAAILPDQTNCPLIGNRYWVDEGQNIRMVEQ